MTRPFRRRAARRRAAVALATAVAAATAVAPAVAGDPADPGNPPITVGTGDVTAGGIVLFAKTDAAGPLTFEVSTTPEFSGDVVTVPVTVDDPAIPAKAALDGLASGTRHYVRVTDAAGDVGEATFRTAAMLGERGPLRIATMTDWQQSPPFTTVANLPERNPDLILKLGDTIYADTETRGLPGVVQARTLEQFRIKQREIISSTFGIPGDDFMSPVYALAPIFATIDDHEIVDNFAGGAAPGESPDAPLVNPGEPPLFTDDVDFVNQTQAYQDAMQAYFEHHPLEATVWEDTDDPRVEGRPRIYRHRTFGSTASVTMLDARSFRDVQLPPVADPTDPLSIIAFLASTFTPDRTLLGEPQLEQLKADLLADQAAGVTWKIVVIPEPIQNFGVVNAEDRFEGYAAERTELLSFIGEAGIENVVFVAGDFHGTIVNDLAYQVPGKAGLDSIPIPAFEIVTGPMAFFGGRFGPSVATIAAAAGLITPEQFAFYQSLDTPGQDAFVRELVDAQIVPLGYSPVGLEDATLLDAELLDGSYFAAHTFSWTELDIDAQQRLTVTTWGIDAFDDATAEADPEAVLALEPRIVSQFRVNPAGFEPVFGDLDGDGTVGSGDLLLLLAAWGPCDACPEDLDGDGTVDFGDLLQLLQAWG